MSACSNLGLFGRRHSHFGRMEFGRPKQILPMKSKTSLFLKKYWFVLKVDTLGSDDLTIFKYFRVIFFLKMKTIQFPLSFNFYFQQKRALKLSICHLPTKRSVWVFDITNRTNGFYNFQLLSGSSASSLAKSCTLFWKYS